MTACTRHRELRSGCPVCSEVDATKAPDEPREPPEHDDPHPRRRARGRDERREIARRDDVLHEAQPDAARRTEPGRWRHVARPDRIGVRQVPQETDHGDSPPWRLLPSAASSARRRPRTANGRTTATTANASRDSIASATPEPAMTTTLARPRTRTRSRNASGARTASRACLAVRRCMPRSRRSRGCAAKKQHGSAKSDARRGGKRLERREQEDGDACVHDQVERMVSKRARVEALPAHPVEKRRHGSIEVRRVRVARRSKERRSEHRWQTREIVNVWVAREESIVVEDEPVRQRGQVGDERERSDDRCAPAKGHSSGSVSRAFGAHVIWFSPVATLPSRSNVDWTLLPSRSPLAIAWMSSPVMVPAVHELPDSV